MPYRTNRDEPAYVRRRYGAKKQRQWRHVWESAYRRSHDEAAAFREANGVVRRKSLAALVPRGWLSKALAARAASGGRVLVLGGVPRARPL
jgi:cation transport regulator ChaB